MSVGQGERPGCWYGVPPKQHACLTLFFERWRYSWIKKKQERKKKEKQALPRTASLRYECQGAKRWGGGVNLLPPGDTRLHPEPPSPPTRLFFCSSSSSTPAGSPSQTSGHILLCTAWSSPPSRAGTGRSSGSRRNRWGFWSSRGYKEKERWGEECQNLEHGAKTVQLQVKLGDPKILYPLVYTVKEERFQYQT